ncbi:hypothetical protein BDW_04935 [Bdellovibrio bacteriovorus W]|nr:hypothetical protein BDW_04935 [Bdellovibrio bacteriovorus W]
MKIINERREEIPGIKTAADPLTWTTLRNKKSSFEISNLLPQWNFLFICLWLGLRPKECDNLKNLKTLKTEYDFSKKVQVIWIYQSKLASLKKEDPGNRYLCTFPSKNKPSI